MVLYVNYGRHPNELQYEHLPAVEVASIFCTARFSA